MSWLVFMNKVHLELSGGTQDKQQFTKTLMKEYHNSIQRHVDIPSGGGKFSTLRPDPVIQLLQVWAELNLMSPPDVAQDTNFLDQCKFCIPIYWIGAVATGGTGVSTVLFPGIWLPVELPPNQNMMIMLTKFSLLSILHKMTMLGTFTNSTSGITVPWSGVMLQTAG